MTNIPKISLSTDNNKLLESTEAEQYEAKEEMIGMEMAAENTNEIEVLKLELIAYKELIVKYHYLITKYQQLIEKLEEVIDDKSTRSTTDK